MAAKPPKKALPASVVEWRLEVLQEAGYPETAALALAYANVDLHRACDLLAQGCPVELALKILT